MEVEFYRHNIGPREIQRMVATLGSTFLTTGPRTRAFEAQLQEYLGVRHAVGVSSWTMGAFITLKAMGVGPGDEVIVPSFTFFASVSCITRLGATPVFVDIRPDTFNIDVDRIPEAITEKTKAIIPVHLFGQCAEIDRICQLACEHDLPVIEDAAQAIGAAYHSRPAGSWGLIGCFSFYPTKNLGGMGDGGMMTSCDAATADRLRLFAGHGMRPRYYHQVVGINSRLDTFQAAVLRVKLKHLPAAVEARSSIAERYGRMLTEENLVDQDAITLPTHDANAFHVWNQYAIRVAGGRRDALRAHLAEHGVGSEIYYPVPMHQQECFTYLQADRTRLVETERASEEVLNLPIFPSLTESEQCRVIEVVADYFASAANKVAA